MLSDFKKFSQMIFKMSEYKMKLSNGCQFYTDDSNSRPYQTKLQLFCLHYSVLKSNFNVGKESLITVHLSYSSRYFPPWRWAVQDLHSHTYCSCGKSCFCFHFRPKRSSWPHLLFPTNLHAPSNSFHREESVDFPLTSHLKIQLPNNT